MSDPSAKARPVRMVFTSRAGGASSSPYDSFNLAHHVDDEPEKVAANRTRLAGTLDVDAGSVVWMEQLHTNTVTVVDKPQSEPVEATDALVTTTGGLVLAVMVADCVPVLLADHSNGVAAAVHAGRRGARNGIVKEAVKKMVELGAEPASTQVVMGPAACGRHYEVPKEMADDVEAHLPGSRTRTDQGTWGLDIRVGLIRQLMSLGITAIDSHPACTIEDESFFSHRRDGETGRQAGLIWLTEEK